MTVRGASGFASFRIDRNEVTNVAFAEYLNVLRLPVRGTVGIGQNSQRNADAATVSLLGNAIDGSRPYPIMEMDEGYLTFNDPDFETKAADFIGLYLNPPQNAVVFSVDEKTAIRALDCLDLLLPLSPGRAERHGFEYFRHGKDRNAPQLSLKPAATFMCTSRQRTRPGSTRLSCGLQRSNAMSSLAATSRPYPG